jgi:hypothetical protein
MQFYFRPFKWLIDEHVAGPLSLTKENLRTFKPVDSLTVASTRRRIFRT